MPIFILIRHGETRKNLSRSLHSLGDPESLNEKGTEQMKMVSNELKKFVPFKLYCSYEDRARQSADIISGVLGVPVVDVAGLEERNWGEYAGKNWDEVKSVLDQMGLEERYNFIPKGGESWKNFETRLIKAVKNITSNETTNVVVVTHGGAIRALMPYLLNAPKEESFKYDPDNASLTIFEFDKNGFSKTTG